MGDVPASYVIVYQRVGFFWGVNFSNFHEFKSWHGPQVEWLESVTGEAGEPSVKLYPPPEI